MTNLATSTNDAPPPRRRGAWVYLLLPLVLVGGLYAGARWHERLGPLVGLGGAPAEPQPAPARATSARQLWTCGMHPQVIRDKPGTCPICRMALTPVRVDPGGGTGASAPGAGGAAPRRIKYWWDPMLNPPYISDKPGKSPMGMDLIPVYEDGQGAASTAGVVIIDPAVVQNMGVRTAVVTQGPLTRTLRLPGVVNEAQPGVRDVSLRASGWIRRLYASSEGQYVAAGDPLFDLYSPELQTAIEELIAARRARAGAGGGGSDATDRTAGMLFDAALNRLEVLGLDREQIDALAALERAPSTVTFRSQIAGIITDKPVVEGAAVKAGERVLRIVDHSTVWIDAQVFQRDLPLVKVGGAAEATVAARPGEPILGTIIAIQPHMDMMTRTATVRMSVSNPGMSLLPGMYAAVRVTAKVAERAVLAPREAVIDTGDRQVVFIPLKGGRFALREVKVGAAGEGGLVQVVEGLAPGESVVTSGQFLIDSESRLREAVQKFLSERGPAAPKVEGASVDAVAAAYLRVAAALGAGEAQGPPPAPSLDMTDLASAAEALRRASAGTAVEALARGVEESARAARGQPLERQRLLLGPLSDAVIALVDAAPPTTNVGGKDGVLFVMNCPMAPEGVNGDWLQTSPDVANPYFARDMKECGSQMRVITLRKAAP